MDIGAERCTLRHEGQSRITASRQFVMPPD